MTPAQTQARRKVLRDKIARLQVKKAEVAAEIAQTKQELRLLPAPVAHPKPKKKASKK